MTGIVFVLGIIITCFMVKEKKVQRNYIMSDDKKKVVRHKDKIALDEDPNENSDEESYTHVIVPATYKFVRGVTLSCWDKTKLLFKQTIDSIRGDLMTQFVLYATFVNQMFKSKIYTFTYLWLVGWAIDSEDQKIYDHDLYSGEAWDIYQKIKVVNFIVAFVFIPIYGFYTDKVPMGHEMMLSFGIRAVASMAFFQMDNPHGNFVIFTFVMIYTSATLQGTVIDALYTKRLEGDIRG